MNTIDSNELITKSAKVSIHKLNMSKGILYLDFSVRSLNKDQDLTFISLSLIKRDNEETIITLPVTIKSSDQQKSRLCSRIQLSELSLDSFYWDFYVSIQTSAANVEDIRVICDHYLVLKKLRHLMKKFTLITDQNYMVYPYVTVNGGLSITYRKKGEFEEPKHKIMEYTAYFFYGIIYKFIPKSSVWLIHEKFSETAQDNSFYFFRYCYEKYPKKKVYYVIKKGAKDEKQLAAYKDKVIYFMSFKHLLLLMSSKLIISSEAKGHGYAWRVSRGVFKKVITAKKFVFLQHGVLGLKKVDSTFNYDTQNSAELFVASSDYEKEIIRSNFGYNTDQIMVTGLARWDVLEDKSQLKGESEKKEILLMPTWRNWLEEVEEDQFIRSDYYQEYNQLLQSASLHEFLKEENLLLNFYVHPKFMPYVSTFVQSSGHIRVMEFGDESVNELIMRASVLITDYSSVAWEMYYQSKPVIFYHFDLEKYNQYQGSYMDFKKELFGDVAYTNAELISKLKHSSNLGFKENESDFKKKKNYFKYVDHQNSQRIYNEIILLDKKLSKRKLNVLAPIRNSDFLKTSWRRYKHNTIVKWLINKLNRVRAKG
ncbi:CDP-glycerol glycerophosphotransferase family protein [Alkalicoccobacillus gibsonii]|uniref:CDP-glycerol glycerophosphotransferase family protein n=1 Tax=Alkalicoccobacillus gibsonii TaxID=79881 RepID=UPI001931624E|nr:CDP-glycerol glycerophosphotransferase family protein [Alkalicoccobacillus gibsonii]MBM0066071.1 CDP-glycerol glycerophosphotransferase family protein [Alkalicoccobacillus gibsonii]